MGSESEAASIIVRFANGSVQISNATGGRGRDRGSRFEVAATNWGDRGRRAFLEVKDPSDAENLIRARVAK